MCVCVCVAQSPNRMAHIHTLTKTYINGLRALLLLYIIIIIIVHYTYDNIVRVFSIYIKLFANATIIWIELCCMSSGRGQLKICCLTTPSTCRKLICFFLLCAMVSIRERENLYFYHTACRVVRATHLKECGQCRRRISIGRLLSFVYLKAI